MSLKNQYFIVAIYSGFCLNNVIVFQLVIVIRFLYSCLQFLSKLPLADPVWLIFQIYILQLYWKLTPPWKFPWKLSSFFHKNFFLTATVSKDFFQIVMFYSTKYLRKSNFIWFNGQEIEDQSFEDVGKIFLKIDIS